MNPYDNQSNGNNPHDEHEKTSLLSGAYLRMYRRVLLLGMPIAALVITGVSLLTYFFTPGESWRFWIMGIRVSLGGGPIAAVANIILGLLLTFGVITVVFICLQKFNVDISSYGRYADDSDDRNYIGPAGPIGEIMLAIATTMLFLGFPFLMAGRFDGRWITIFDTAALRALWLPIIAWTAFEIISEITKLIDRKYTARVCIITVLCGIACAISAIYVFGNAEIINPEFLYYVLDMNYIDSAPNWLVDHIVMQPNRVPLGIMLAVIFFEVVDVVYYTAKFRILQSDTYES